MAKNHKIKRYNNIYRVSGKRKAAKTAGILLLVGLLAAVGWFLYPPVYDFILSYGQAGKVPLPPEPSESSSLSQQPSSGSQSETLPPAQEPDEGQLKMAYVPHNVAANAATLDSYINALPKGYINTVVLDLKNQQGQVLYATGVAAATRSKAVVADAYSLADVVQHFKAAGIQVVGRFWAFKDHYAPLALYDASVKYLGTEYNWLDNSVESGGKPWLNPHHPEAQQYLLSLVDESLNAGVSGIVMAGVQFPEGYSLEKADYGTTAPRSEALAAFMAKVQQQVAAKDGIGCWGYFSAPTLLAPPEGKLGPYGESLTTLTRSAGLIVEVMPALFGAELALPGGPAIAAPITKPYETVKAVLAAAGVDGSGQPVVPVVQAYTQQGYAAAYNLTYTKAQVDAQLKAAAEQGLESGYLLYSPTGDYALLR